MWGRYPQAAFQPREAYVRPWEGNPSWQRQECVSNTRQWVTSRTPQWDVVFTWVNLSPRLHIALLFEAGAWWNDRSVRRQRSEQSGEQTTSSSEGNILYPVSHCCCFANEAGNRTCDFSLLRLIADMMFSGLVQWGKQICLHSEIIVQLPKLYSCCINQMMQWMQIYQAQSKGSLAGQCWSAEEVCRSFPSVGQTSMRANVNGREQQARQHSWVQGPSSGNTGVITWHPLMARSTRVHFNTSSAHTKPRMSPNISII